MKLIRKLKDLSFLQKFNGTSLVILLVSLVVMGSWISNQIETSVVDRIGHATALFVNSVVGSFVEDFENSDDIGTEAGAELNRMLTETSLGEEIVALKIWDSAGKVIHSSNSTEIGMIFPMEGGLARAWDGIVSAEVSRLDRQENIAQRIFSDHLLEIYSPVREHGTGKIVAVVEFYQKVTALDREIANAQRESWLVVTAVVLGIYLALVVLFIRGNRTIVQQQGELEHKVNDLSALLLQNTELAERVRAAAARSTALNERYLSQIAGELHDGPAQDLGYALLKIEDIDKEIDGLQTSESKSIKESLRRAMEEIRNISAGLRSPGLENLDMDEVIQRAVRVHSSRTETRVLVTTKDLPDSAPVAVKIATFRVLQEALNNAFRHGGEDNPMVNDWSENGSLYLEIADQGSGIDDNESLQAGVHLGLAVMRERVEMLGGRLMFQHAEPKGTIVKVVLPPTYRGFQKNE